ncbi:MAG: phosphoribosylaminoimidazolesuccinocarboxamide synthase [Deltaproteobacteria bacterium]|nr:phosphoribosylaminoimidazolesuccinocarboxamide synthase [Deltaproteobacteria bacterium]
MDNVVLQTELPDLKLVNRGKVRDMYDLGDSLLMVSTDRISAYDVVMAEGIPDKGKVLTGMTEFWLEHLSDVVPNHLISSDVNEFPSVCAKYADILAGRSMLVEKAEPVMAECIVRGYITGSGWKDYLKTGAICGIALPAGMQESEVFPEPLFTPSTKADVGDHDENISFEQAGEVVGKEVAEQLRDLTIRIYLRAREIAEERGIIIADTKLEFGMVDGKIILIDEVLTPDSSRFWPQDEYAPGRGQMSYDKQFVRDYLSSLDWDKNPPPPALPDDIIKKTTGRYIEAYERLTGNSFSNL